MTDAPATRSVMRTVGWPLAVLSCVLMLAISGIVFLYFMQRGENACIQEQIKARSGPTRQFARALDQEVHASTNGLTRRQRAELQHEFRLAVHHWHTTLTATSIGKC